jgi:hypothetical protein
LTETLLLLVNEAGRLGGVQSAAPGFAVAFMGTKACALTQ